MRSHLSFVYCSKKYTLFFIDEYHSNTLLCSIKLQLSTQSYAYKILYVSFMCTHQRQLSIYLYIIHTCVPHVCIFIYIIIYIICMYIKNVCMSCTTCVHVHVHTYYYIIYTYIYIEYMYTSNNLLTDLKLV